MNMGQDFAHLFGRELDRLAEEIGKYDDDADLWSTLGEQKNPPGALALHIVGGLNSMVGATLGATGYVRDRDLEFSGRDVPKDEILQQISACRDTIVPILERLEAETLAAEYPGRTPPHMQGSTTRLFLMHLLWHVGWHQGQIRYHRLGRQV